jgi:hypothetical protein
MTESPQSPEPGQNPTDDDIEVEGPNEGEPGHQPDPDEQDTAADPS